jgi:hypothetical protein
MHWLLRKLSVVAVVTCLMTQIAKKWWQIRNKEDGLHGFNYIAKPFIDFPTLPGLLTPPAQGVKVYQAVHRSKRSGAMRPLYSLEAIIYSNFSRHKLMRKLHSVRVTCYLAFSPFLLCLMQHYTETRSSVSSALVDQQEQVGVLSRSQSMASQQAVDWDDNESILPRFLERTELSQHELTVEPWHEPDAELNIPGSFE